MRQLSLRDLKGRSNPLFFLLLLAGVFLFANFARASIIDDVAQAERNKGPVANYCRVKLDLSSTGAPVPIKFDCRSIDSITALDKKFQGKEAGDICNQWFTDYEKQKDQENAGSSKFYFHDCVSATEAACNYGDPSDPCPTTQQQVVTKLGAELKVPTVAIRIPQLTFSDISKNVTQDDSGNIYLNIPWLGEYLTYLYKFAIAIVSIVAVVMIIIQGARVVTSGGGEAKMDAYKKIIQSIVGLAIAWGSYAILYNINPNLVTFKALRVKYVQNISIPDFEGMAGSSGDADPTRSYASNPELEAVADKVAGQYGFNSCMFKNQIAKESGWRMGEHTKCCYGLGQVSISNAKDILTNWRQSLAKKYSKGEAGLPPTGASDDQIKNWLTSDAEGNLLVAGQVRKWSMSQNNALSTATIYGGGIGTFLSYKKFSGCSPQQMSEDELVNKLKQGANTDELLKGACIPPNTWALPPSKSGRKGCPGGDGLCCVSADGPCAWPPQASDGSGRRGVCHDGTNKGQPCYTTAGAQTYMESYIKNIKNACAK